MPKRLKHLRLVTQVPKPGADNRGVQRRLFPGTNSRLLVFLDMSLATEGMFVNMVSSGVLRVFDLRVAPRFDFGRLTRARVFEMFETLGIAYFDIPGALAFSESQQDLNPYIAAEMIAQRLRQSETPGPNLFLLENEAATKVFSEELPLSLPAPSKKSWEILVPYDLQRVMHASTY